MRHPARVIPIWFAMEMLDIPLRRIFQNPNCFSFVGRNMCKYMGIYNIKLWGPEQVARPDFYWIMNMPQFFQDTVC